ncbi:hypothetical protein CerSpe_276200 [Prunus speciosa]
MGRFDRADSIVRLQRMIRLGLIWGRCNILPCQCIDSVRKWLGNHFYFSKATTPIQGLVFSHSYVNNALVSILITYLSDKWRTSNFAMLALVTNVQESVSDILVIVLARISDTHMTRFKMIVSTNAAYFLGLLLLWICSKFALQTVTKVYYGAVVLMVLGEAGRSATLKEFLENQYFSEDKERPSTDENYLKRLETRKEALWRHPWFLGALLAVFLPTPSWTSTFMVSTILVGVSYLLFLLGYSCYFVSSRIDEYSTWKSCLDYLKKLSLVYPVEQEEEEERGGEICMVTRVTSSSSSSCPPEEVQRKKFWPLIELKAGKGFFIEVIAMWSAFFTYSLVEATGSTFFFEQTKSLDTESGIGSVMDVAVFFILVRKFSSFLVSFIYDLLIPKQWRKATVTLVRIGCGLACSMLCCVVARLVEGKRLKSPVTDKIIEGVHHKIFTMSTWWLIPQFVLLGLMHGLALNGLTEFLADRIANNDRLRARYYYASHISDLILGVGKLVTASSILVFRRNWFHRNIIGSHLDRFLELLTYLSLANLIHYMCISIYFYRNEKSRKSANKANKESSLLEQVEQGIHAAEKEADVEEVPVPVGGADLENQQTAGEQVEQEIDDDDDEELWTSETTKEIKK